MAAMRPRIVAITGADGALGARLAVVLRDRTLRLIDRTRGHELERASTYAELIRGCDAIVHTAALHPLVAPPGTGPREYAAANVAPFAGLLELARRERVGRVVLVSSTSVWANASPGRPARFLDEAVPADATDGYGRSKRDCEELAQGFDVPWVVIRLARFARRGDAEDAVRLLYRAIDPDDAAAAVAAALDRAPSGALYAVSAPTPFRREDAEALASDPGAVIRLRTGHMPRWTPASIGSVVLSGLAERELGWRAAFPSPLYAVPT
jgi:nucleoside-diphosphate-sugar epimerase